MSNILDFFKHLPEAIFGLIKSLFNSAKKEFSNLSPADQQGLINGSKLSEFLKQRIGEAEDAIIFDAADYLGVSPDVAKAAILAVGKDLGVDTGKVSDVLNKLADEAQSAITDNKWNSLWQLVAQSASQWFTQGKFPWATLSMGLLEFVYHSFVKEK